MPKRGGSRKLLAVSESRAALLVDQILERRRKADDPMLSRASDDVPDLIRYVARSSTRQVPAMVLREDVLDALELLEYARGRLPAVPGAWDALEGQLLAKRGAVALSLADIAERLGVTREVRTVMRVLEERLDELAADEDLVDYIEILIAPDDDRRVPAVTDPVGAADMRLLEMVVRKIRASRVFEALPDGSRVRAAVAQGEVLVAEYRELTAGLEKWRRSE
jgi:hypothetical protein